MATCVIGIDLGTTNSVVAGHWKAGPPRFSSNAQGLARLTPSVGRVLRNKGRTSRRHRPARHQQVTHPTKYDFFRIKSAFMGSRRPLRKFPAKREARAVQDRRRFGRARSRSTSAAASSTRPPEISAMDFAGSQKKVPPKDYLGEKKSPNAIVTVPGLLQRFAAPRHQGKLAKNRRSQCEKTRSPPNNPPAGFSPFGADKKKSGNFFVFDLGGGTFERLLPSKVTNEDGDGLFKSPSPIKRRTPTFGGGRLRSKVQSSDLTNRRRNSAKPARQSISAKDSGWALQRLKESRRKGPRFELSRRDGNVPSTSRFITADASGPQTFADDDHPRQV